MTGLLSFTPSPDAPRLPAARAGRRQARLPAAPAGADAGGQATVAIAERLLVKRASIELDARLKHLRSSAALSVISVSASRPRILGPLGYVGYGVWWAFSKLFVIR